jgi:hypothetical protein
MSTPFDFSHKHVFAAGGASGINLGIADAFARAGANVSVCSRDPAKVGSAKALLGQGKEIRWVGTDYADLLKFPDDACRQPGFQLGKVQAGACPMAGIPSTRLVSVPGRFASGRRAVLSGWCMSPSSRKPCTSCIASKRRRRRPAAGTRASPRWAVELWSTRERWK